jgi:hypothetical protein
MAADWIRNRQENMRAEIEQDNARAAVEEANRRDIAAAERKAAEEERQRLNNDPAVLATLRRLNREGAEAKQRAQAEEEARLAEARRDVEREKEHQLNVWLSHGGDEQSFERAWPAMEERYISQKIAAARSQINSVF